MIRKLKTQDFVLYTWELYDVIIDFQCDQDKGLGLFYTPCTYNVLHFPGLIKEL